MVNELSIKHVAIDALVGVVGGSFIGIFTADVLSAIAANAGAFITAAQSGPIAAALGATVAVGMILSGMVRRGEV